MNRLTRKRKDGQYLKAIKSIDECVNKLGQLEDIEDEIGCDLSIVLKALRNGYYYKSIKGKILFSQNSGLVPYQNELELDHKVKLLSEAILKPKSCICVFVRDYGKTWALTKEELL